MLNPREIAELAALHNERCRCISFLAACAVMAVLFAVLAFWCRGAGCWDLCCLVAVIDAAVASAWGCRLARVARRIEALEEFL